ncbi:CPBP family intramembrane glutamic endopeptidase [Staphylococcus pettenkoferi]|uniref:CPBP family intramembrane glutamic endopeptidase n=1 Tax=Staphylococcus pettenkoferi TaxID=170573 RepID=UPI00119DC7C6|nr:type II CAAX endopeptidase family protein [Staphylococcus pettenkoferi]
MKLFKRRPKPTKSPSPWQSSHLMKRDFWLIPSFYILPYIVVLLIQVTILAINPSILQSKENSFTVNALNLTIDTLTLLFVLFIFYLIHIRHGLAKVMWQRFKLVPRYFWLLIVTYIVVMLLDASYDTLTDYLPKSLQFDETQNQEEVDQLFKVGWLTPITFINVAIITPFVEELLFRHLIIHELGKKITYPVAAVLSVIIFTGIHVTGATSPFEIGSYIFMAAGLVYVYMKSGRNLAVSITLHFMFNAVASLVSIFS